MILLNMILPTVRFHVFASFSRRAQKGVSFDFKEYSNNEDCI